MIGSLRMVGRNPIVNEVREMPIVGGTRVFRFARGYCLAKKHSMVGFDVVIGYNGVLIFVFHILFGSPGLV
uniref:Dirigent protein n=1 Tax=Nelumbo nucifera TaxID=4432 RepID=A0A822XSW8_NELNU|nr:TPA_asm: hypothetical protein HUJ06_024266 [Nelumbo nucifera]